MMALPAQVQKQSEAVNKLYDELNKATEGAGADVAEAAEDAVEATPTAHTTDSAEEQAPAPRQEEQKAEGGKDEEETYEQRWRSLQGMYNAEVPRLHAERRELTNRVQQLEQLLASMTSKPAEQAKESAEKLITEQDIEDYGDSIDVMRRVFREEAGALKQENAQLRNMIQQMQANVVPKVQQLSQRQAVSSEQQFWSELQTAVPDWQDINTSQEFQSWLLEVDPLTGVPRQTYLEDAQRNLDARRVVNFFTAWKGQAGVPNARSTRTAQSTSELEKQVAPGKGRSGGNKTAGEPKTYTQADIRNFFTDVQRGKYKGKEAERDRIERDIFAAQREGRIVTA
jgi:hypothetical protein